MTGVPYDEQAGVILEDEEEHEHRTMQSRN